LGDVTREAYFAFLRATRPELIERYERIFRRGRYAESGYVRDVAEQFHTVCRATRFPRRRTLPPDHTGAQLALI
jgi:hypothetical protein